MMHLILWFIICYYSGHKATKRITRRGAGDPIVIQQPGISTEQLHQDVFYNARESGHHEGLNGIRIIESRHYIAEILIWLNETLNHITQHTFSYQNIELIAILQEWCKNPISECPFAIHNKDWRAVNVAYCKYGNFRIGSNFYFLYNCVLSAKISPGLTFSWNFLPAKIRHIYSILGTD